MGIKIEKSKFENIFESIQSEYKIYAPKSFEGRGPFSDTDLITYDEISKLNEIVWDQKSRYSPKEAVMGVTQIVFKYVNGEIITPEIDKRGIIVFLRPCDINAFSSLDNIFLNNGEIEDPYYKMLREKIKFVMIECTEGFENCFCVSMGTNKTDNYSMAIRYDEKELLLDIKDEFFDDLFDGEEKIDFHPEFIKENEIKVDVPDIEKMPIQMYEDDMWRDYDRCIACGRCTLVCPTCSCFSTYDVQSEEDSNVGEKRRVHASCQIKGYTDMAGGHEFRSKHGDKMRFKAFHKVYDYKKRFGKHMCVGCGRCDDACPEYISFSTCITKITKRVKEVYNDDK